MYDDYNGKMREDNVSCTLTPNTGSSTERNGQKVVLPVLTPDRGDKRQNGRRFKENGDPAFTLTSEDRHGVAVGVLRTIRSEYGKEIRKDYEEGKIDISRHDFLEHEIREDGVANTVYSVTKDNLLGIGIEGNYMASGHNAGNVISQGGITDSYGESRNGQRGHGPSQGSNKERLRRCEGGAGQYQPLNAGIENKKRTSRGRYGEYVGYIV